LAGLNVTGPVTLASDVVSTGDQTYGAPVTLSVGGFQNPLTIQSVAGNVTLNGTVSAGTNAKQAQRSLSLMAGGRVTIGDQIGLPVRQLLFGQYQGTTDTSPYALSVQASEIYLLADVTTFEQQRYIGSVFIGDNGSNGFMRTLISLDPRVSFLGTVDAVIEGLHGLDVRAYSLAASLNEVPIVEFEGAVGRQRALASLFVDVGLQNPSPLALVATPAPNVPLTTGVVTLADDVTTTGSQFYRGNTVDLGVVGREITLNARSGTVDIVVGAGPGAGVQGLDRLRFDFGDFTQLGPNLIDILTAADFDIFNRFVRTGVISLSLRAPQGSTAAGVLNRIGVLRDSQLTFGGELAVELDAEQASSVLMMSEVDIGQIEALTCATDSETGVETCEAVSAAEN